ncbi:MAG TPA: hydroxymethylglutaryl-CoA lyase [Candidatus Dormibacteraeota bacterium]|jgi:(R)-citramalyl-CoA lyase|nr:hydroxymethylglutaryl-CoA lyase [Candidatus Dormibacteraeota bacterium]
MTVTVCDVGPRDGLQNEAVTLPPAVRAELCDRLFAAGLPVVEAVSFVHPRLVPQMAGAEEVVAAVRRRQGVVLAGLVLNERGFERALAAGVDEIHYAFPVTDAFARRNQNTTVEDAIATGHRLVSRARDASLPVTVTLSVAFGCPFEGGVTSARVLRVVEEVLRVPPDAVVVADTIGVGVPAQARELVRGLLELGVRAGCHFHNTRNTGLANALAALEAGATLFDASVGGTGGCPFAPKATGNVPTEDLVYLFHGQGVPTGIDLEALTEVSRWLGSLLGRELPAMVSRAGDFPAVSGRARAVS